MKIFLPVFLSLCLCAAPVFSQNAQAPAATDVVKTTETNVQVEVTDEASVAQVDAEYGGIPMRQETPVVGASAEEAAMFGSDVPQFSMLRTFGGMGLVLCLLIGAYLGIRKFAPGYFPKMASEGKNLKIVESIGMGDRRSIALVEVGGKRFLIGSTPQQINMLTALPEHFSLVAEENDAPVATVAPVVKEEGERRAFRNLFDMEKKRPGKHADNVFPDEIRMKMRRLREALENR